MTVGLQFLFLAKFNSIVIYNFVVFFDSQPMFNSA